jgi:YD repeat-containing protein
MVSVTDPLSTEFTYCGDLVSVETPLGHTMTRLTDAAGRLVRVTDAMGPQTRFEPVGAVASIQIDTSALMHRSIMFPSLTNTASLSTTVGHLRS